MKKWKFYPVSENVTAPPPSIDGNLALEFLECTQGPHTTQTAPRGALPNMVRKIERLYRNSQMGAYILIYFIVDLHTVRDIASDGQVTS
jgi:hypothetical protein